ncbi:borealin [Dunckerocampus dactyliophorus]|uniref:borealin n=1 Tax=Dunckerocampus dactyliophorus TaxID=161453 RepID=UPI0024071848|nr:borealin [Dunckerocampus dactyliophorus]
MAPSKKPHKKNNIRTAKLEAFLEDFDSEVETRLFQLREKKNQLLKDADNHYNMALVKIPKAVRQINWLEYFKTEEAKSLQVDDVMREAEAAIIENVVAEAEKKTVKKITKTKGGAKSNSGDESVPRTSRRGKTTRKPPTSSKRAKAHAVSQQNTSIRRSSRKALVTPARTMLDSSLLMGPTPLITPRFDPRLPKTPAVRIPRHKERVYSISVNGSPIAAANHEVVVNIPLGNGESMPLMASQINSVDLSMLDETALRSIRHFVSHITSLTADH